MASLVVLTMVPAVFMTIHIVRQSVFNNNVNRFIKAELQQRGTQIISNSIDRDSLRLRVVAVGKVITEAHQQEAQKRMAFYGLDGYQLRVIQGENSVSMLNDELTALTTSRQTEHQQMVKLSAEVSALSNQLDKYTRYESLSKEIRSEMAVLFPNVISLSLSRVAEVNGDTTAAKHYVAAIVKTSHGKPMPHADAQKLREWLQSRIKTDSLVVMEHATTTTGR